MPKGVSLFAGAAGSLLGFREAGYEMIYASDINSNAIATYRLNFPQIPSVAEDIAQIEFERLLVSPTSVGAAAGAGSGVSPPQPTTITNNAMVKKILRNSGSFRPEWG